MDENGQLPTFGAFMPRDSEDYLSVNWLEYFAVGSRDREIERVRDVLRAKLKLVPAGRVVVLNVGEATNAVYEHVKHLVRIEHLPEDADPSHAGILDYPSDEKAVAIVLQFLIGLDDVYAAVPQVG